MLKALLESVEEDKMLRIVDLLKRKISFWNEDITSPEANEYAIMHCFTFGKGVDKTLQEILTSSSSVQLFAFLCQIFSRLLLNCLQAHLE